MSRIVALKKLSISTSESFSDTEMQRMGDSAANCLLVMYSPQELRKSAMEYIELSILREAFSSPNLIEGKMDSKPLQSLFLIDAVLVKSSTYKHDPVLSSDLDDFRRRLRAMKHETR